MGSIELKDRLAQDMAEFKQARQAALMDVEHPAMALTNYHRMDAVVAYIARLLQAMATPNEETDVS